MRTPGAAGGWLSVWQLSWLMPQASGLGPGVSTWRPGWCRCAWRRRLRRRRRASRVLVITAKAALLLTRAAGMQFTATPRAVSLRGGCHQAGGDPRTGRGSFPPANPYSILDTC
jgi:hypothetical protein